MTETNTENPSKNPSLPVIAVLGIGNMGFPMARRLCEAGYEVHAWNRSREKADRLQPFGATVHDDAADAVRNADTVISLLENGPVVTQVLFGDGSRPGIVASMRRGALVIDMASIQPREARDHAARLGEAGIAHLDSPVSGGTVGAEKGELAIMAGGQTADFERALPALRVLGRPTHVGPHGSGQLAKLANQMIVGITMGAVAEALLFASRGGADMGKVREALMGGFADSRILQLHGLRMVERDFAPRARMSIQLKDMRNALATAGEIGFDAPITALFEQLYADGVEHGLTDLDQSGLFVELASRNGMS
ncbi:MAG: NAD(P)-dependent oxidoreductase [Comamonadaceae bacterium]|nr:MAG: NAD(P)-dependent oxidoreductase [Comamonadaceae bacterium]